MRASWVGWLSMACCEVLSLTACNSKERDVAAEQGGASAGDGSADSGNASIGGKSGSGGGGPGAAAGAPEGGTGDEPGNAGAGGGGLAATGQACSENRDCDSELCRDGICCESACSLDCQACAEAVTGLADGECGTPSGATTQACPADDPTECVDVMSDASNCGSCGKACPGSTSTGAVGTCNNGACGLTCPAGSLGDGSSVCVPVSTIAAGDKFTCALLASGKVSCWGETGAGIDPVAAGVSDFVFTSLSAHFNQVCGIRDSGQIVCWGASPSTHTGPYFALATGDYHTCGIRSNQTLECWSSDQDAAIEAEPSGKYKGIASMNHYACAIISGGATDGQLKCWGDSANYDFRKPPTSTVFTRVVGGSSHACGVKADKTITCWGLLSYPNFPATTEFKTLGSGGGTHYCGILTDDTIFCWGSDGGEGGPAASEPAGSFKALALGSNHTCGITTAGRVVCAGNDSWGQAQNQPGPFQGYW